jgi:osmoprotectant transport system permease protein
MASRARPSSAQRAWSTGTLVIAFALGAWAYAGGLLPAIYGQRGDILYLGGQHLVLVALSGALSVAIGIPVGVVLARPRLRRWGDLVLQLLNVGATIPTLAFLALSMSVLGIGAFPAIIGLFAATVLPVASNTLAGIRAVPDHLVAAAQGMGMTPRQILRQVELPNAMFVIYAGIRTAFAINVGTAALAFLIGGGGLGELIFTGIALDDFGMMLAGAIPTALLAVLVDLAIGQLQFWTTPRGVNPLR